MRSIFIALVLSACVRPVTPPVTPKPLPELSDCPAVDVQAEQNCAGVFTKDDVPLACFNCGPTAQGCYLRKAGIYCTKNGCVNDSRCAYDSEATPVLRTPAR